MTDKENDIDEKFEERKAAMLALAAKLTDEVNKTYATLNINKVVPTPDWDMIQIVFFGQSAKEEQERKRLEKQQNLPCLLPAGYTREMKTIFNMKNIPDKIVYAVDLYQRCDKWEDTDGYNHVSINNYANKLTSTLFSIRTVGGLGCHVVSTGVFKWKIRLNLRSNMRYCVQDHIYVGIMDDDHLCSFDDMERMKYGYLFHGVDGRFVDRDNVKEMELRWEQPNDVLDVQLDMNQKSLIFIVNGTDSVVACDNVRDGRYRLVVGCNKADGTQFEFL